MRDRSEDAQHASFSVADAAQRLGVSAAKVRRLAETYRDFLGLRRPAHGEWTFSPGQLRFIGVLAAGGTPVQAGSALRSAAWPATPPTSLQAGAPLGAHPAPPDGPRATAAVADGPGPDSQAGSNPDLAHRDLLDRIEDLTLCVEDLAEETKQVQILLSRIIALLEDGGRAERASVRPWEPAELIPAPGVVHALMPPPHAPACSDAD